MPQKGTHTWDLVVMYHRCPKCDFIFESRQPYAMKERRIKEETCPRCQYVFELVKQAHSKGPLLGEPTKPEFTWDA